MIQKRKVNADRLQTKNVSDKLNSAKSKSEHENFIKAWNERIRSIHNLQEVNFMVVQHNLTALNANRYYGINNNKLSKSLEKLSSGYAINRAGDNAAGLAVSEKMRAQISGLTQATKNAQDGISMVQTFEGALTETDSILQRMRSLAVQSANGTYQNDVDREAIQLEFDQLNDELNQISDTDFNGVIVLNGGQMADGTKADGLGNIDYSTATRSAQQIGTAGGFVKGIGARDYDDQYLKDNGMTSERATFTAAVDENGNVTWTTDGKGTLALNQKNGGFSYAGVTVNVDTTKVVQGDKIVLDLTSKKEAAAQASEVVGYNTIDSTVVGDMKTKLSFTIDTGLDADAIKANPKLAEALNALNGMTVEETIDATAAKADATKAGAIKINGTPNKAGAATDIMELSDGGKIQLADDGLTLNYVNGGTTVALGKFTVSEANAAQAADATVKTQVLVTEASYTAPTDAGAKLVEPDSKVSQSNSNDASTATLTYKKDITLQVGARTKDSVNFTFNYESNGLGGLKADLDCSARGLGTDKLSLATQEDANAAIDKIDNAINKVSMVRGTFGAMQNRLEHKIDNLNTTNENLTAAESRIRDTNMAEEMMNFTKNQILSQAAQSMLAQANQLPQSVLQLLQ